MNRTSERTARTTGTFTIPRREETPGVDALPETEAPSCGAARSSEMFDAERGWRSPHRSLVGAPDIGRLALRSLRIPEDIDVVHRWVTKPYAHFWGMQGLDHEGVTQAYRAITTPARASALLGHFDGLPAFVVECYHPQDDVVGRFYPAEDADRGMHLLVGPPERPVSGFTRAVFFLVMDYLFADPQVARVVVEPDVRNEKIRTLNRRAGFIEEAELPLPATDTTPEKVAVLSFCTRDRYVEARAREERSS